MKWKAIHKVRMVHFRESVIFGEKTTFVYGTMWDKGWDRKALCPDVQIFSSVCYRVLCDLVEFYHSPRLIHFWMETSIKYFTQETSLSIKLGTAIKSSVYVEVSSQPCEDQTQAGADREDSLGTVPIAVLKESLFNILQMNHMFHNNS